MVYVVYQNVADGLENIHAFLEWYREEEIEIVFVGEAWIERNGRGTQTHSSFVLISTAKRERKVLAYTRKGMEAEVEVVKKKIISLYYKKRTKNR